MKIALVLGVFLYKTVVCAQSSADSLAINSILKEEVVAWTKGDAAAYSQHFATDGTFTNILGLFFTGHKDFLDRHDQIFKGVFPEPY